MSTIIFKKADPQNGYCRKYRPSFAGEEVASSVQSEEGPAAPPYCWSQPHAAPHSLSLETSELSLWEVDKQAWAPLPVRFPLATSEDHVILWPCYFPSQGRARPALPPLFLPPAGIPGFFF